MSKRRVLRWASAVTTVAVLVIGAVWVVTWFQNRVPGKIWDLDSVCDGKAYPDAAPNAGPPPHPLVAFMPNDYRRLDYDFAASTSDATDWEPRKPKHVQLVACGELLAEAPVVAATCQFTGSPGGGPAIPLVEATYRVRVYEVRTHRQVRSVVIDGEDTRCPEYVSADNPPESFLSTLTPEQWRQTFGYLVLERP